MINHLIVSTLAGNKKCVSLPVHVSIINITNIVKAGKNKSKREENLKHDCVNFVKM